MPRMTRPKTAIAYSTPDGKSTLEKGSFFEVHKRQSDGAWPYARLIWHSDLPLPAPK
jgi:hypothetical protein